MNMASPITQQTLTRFAPADAVLRRTVSDWGIRAVSAFGSAACRMVGPRVGTQFGILLYHRIADEVVGIERPTINVSPRRFESQIRGLVQAGFVFWPLRRVLDCVARGEHIPPYVVVLTFDDGFEGVYRNAWPVLRELNVSATVFLATAYLGSEQPFPFDHWGQRNSRVVPSTAFRPLNIAQCRELAASGLIEFGAHTHTHEDFRHRPIAFRKDLETNIETLQKLFGRSDVTFAFPYGTPRLGYVDASLTNAARETGVRCALTTHSSLVKPGDSPFAWGRFTVFPWDNSKTLAAKLGGWYGWAPALKNRLLGRDRGEERLTGRGKGESGKGKAESGVRSAKSHASTGLLPLNSQPSTLNPQLSTLNPQLSTLNSQLSTLSVIVPTFNRADWLADALHSLTRQQTDGRFEFEIVVCDNASTDNTASVVASVAESSMVPIRYCFQSKVGDAPTRNRALQEATGQWLAFFDDDQLAPENWLSELVAAAEKTGGSIVGGAVQLDLSAQQRSEFCFAVCEALRETDLYPQLQPYLRQALPGTGNALVSRAVFDAIGDFDESFVSGGSDYEFFGRARAAGFAMWYTPDAVIRHRVDPSRLSMERLRLDALSGGAEHAEHIDLKRLGLRRVLGSGLARAVQAVVIHTPLMLEAWLRHDRGRVLGRCIRLWRTEGYLRKCIALVAPTLFPQQRFFDSLSFRHGRPPTKVQQPKAQQPKAQS
jgi:glycosyltransferase involved in cell wall biosynthesis/peptidoglycan/xylan/chitin deacetylase (PgdA/CDA1 family)